MSENGHKHGEYDASADAFVINKTNAKSVQSETNIAEQEQPAVIKTSNKEPFDTKYAVKTIPLDYDDADICCTCGGISWRPRAHCVSATVFCIMLAIILPVTLIDKSDSSRAVGLVPTVAPTSETEILAVDDELLTEAPSDFLTEEPSEIAIFVTTVPHTTVPIAAPVVIMPVLTLSPTDAVTDIVMPSVDPVDTVVTDTPTTLTPTSLSPTPLPTAEQPSLTLTPSGDVISNAAPPQSQFGYTLSLSRDGNTLSVGSPHYENKGMARVYALSSSAEDDRWQRRGPDFYGDETDDWYGWAAPLAANGSVLATSGGLGGKNGGAVPYVRVYEYVSPDGWSRPRGGDLTGDFGFGNFVSLSADGGRIAVGAKKDVSVFGYDEEGDKWDLMGVLKEKYASVALSESGYILAVGGPYSSDVYDEGGVVNVWEYKGGESWLLRGAVAAIYGNDAMEQFGYSVAISNDGSVVAAGSLEANYVKVSRFIDGTWIPYGEDIQGEKDDNNKFGFKVALSGDAKRLVVGSPLYMDYNGRSVVYNFNNRKQTWDNVMDVVGTNTNDQEGYAVAISSDGTSIATSAMSANNGTGRVRVFNLQ